MKESPNEAVALRPLWWITLGAVAGASATVRAPATGPAWLPVVLVLAGIGMFAAALFQRHRAPTVLWLAAGLALTGGHGLHDRGGRLQLAAFIDPDASSAVRARLVVTEGWVESRWGWRNRVRVIETRHNDRRINLPSRCGFEVRGRAGPSDLPRPGRIVEALISVRGTPSSPLLVASSFRLLEPSHESRLVPLLRDRLAGFLLAAAGTDVGRIRAAELAATLALGRRDLVPDGRREAWRRSGLAHVLAVSGLHVGLVAGMTWLLWSALGAGPTTARVAILLVLPAYAILAGGSPSAVRAALMGAIYVGARLAGRAILPMAAVLLTATLLLSADPALIGEVSFQLTMALTASLVRWAPTVAAAIPGPRWLGAAIAIPVIAQATAAPLVAVHFQSLIPGAAFANLLVPWLLGPVVLAAVGATAAAPVWTGGAAWLLEVVGAGEKLLWWVSAPGRTTELVPPALGIALVAVFTMAGFAALFPGRRARVGAVVFLGLLCGIAVWWFVLPPTVGTEVELVPVSEGLACRVSSPDGHILVDGGNREREAAIELASSQVRRLAAVIASHGDEDHTRGLIAVLRTTPTRRLVVPVWLVQRPEGVPLLRIARRRGVDIVPVAAGSALDLGPARIEVLWPPAVNPPAAENERSLVARLRLDGETVLVTSDIGRTAERALLDTTNLDCDVLLVPHHGSRHSASSAFLDAADPVVALIPAGPANLHHHPHPELIGRLELLGVRYRMPIRDGRCGARWEDGEWRLYPP